MTVDDQAIREALRPMLGRGHLYAEAGAVAGLAALLTGCMPPRAERTSVVVVTGGNVDLAQLRPLL